MTDAPITAGERLEGAAARAMARLPARVQRWLSGEPPVVIDGLALHPELQLVRAIRRRRSPYGYCEPTVAAGRARLRRDTLVFNRPKTPVGAVRDFDLEGPGGPLRVRHYAPPSPDDRQAPLTVFLHGGGFVIGDLDTHDEPCRLLCRYAGAHVLSVDYRLAPEHPFPAALEDTCAALRWALDNAATLGADAARVAVGGDSAGANLATVAARLAARAGRPPAAQLLIYPATDSEAPRASHALFGEGFFLSHDDRAAFTRYYLGGTGASGTDPRVSPLRAPDLAGLPPALVVTAGFDILRDEGEAYAAALRAAGTAVRARRESSLGHGFINMTGVSPAARRAVVEIAGEWRAMLDHQACHVHQ